MDEAEKYTRATVDAYRKLDFRLLDDRAADDGRCDDAAAAAGSMLAVGEVSKRRTIVVSVELRLFSEG